MRKIVTLILVLALLALAWLYSSRMPQQSAVEPTRLTINIVDEDAASSLIRVAQTAGYFHQQNLEPTLKTFSTGRQGLQDLLQNQQADYAVAYETPIVKAIGSGHALRLLTSLHTSTANTKLVFMGTQPTNPKAALRGARIGVTMGSSPEYTLSAYLLSLGLQADDIHWVNMGPEEIVQQAGNANLDGVVIWEPFYSKVLDKLDRAQQAYWQPEIGYYREFSFLVTDAARAKRQTEVTVRVLRAVYAAYLLYLNDRPRFLQYNSEFPGIGRDVKTIAKDIQNTQLQLGLTNLMRQELVAEEVYFCLHQVSCDDHAVERLHRAFETDALQVVVPELVTIRRVQ